MFQTWGCFTSYPPALRLQSSSISTAVGPLLLCFLWGASAGQLSAGPGCRPYSVVSHSVPSLPPLLSAHPH